VFATSECARRETDYWNSPGIPELSTEAACKHGRFWVNFYSSGLPRVCVGPEQLFKPESRRRSSQKKRRHVFFTNPREAGSWPSSEQVNACDGPTMHGYEFFRSSVWCRFRRASFELVGRIRGSAKRAVLFPLAEEDGALKVFG